MTLTALADRRISSRDGRIRNNAPMSITRVAWLVTVLVALVTALLLALSGYTGYAGLGIAVAASAAINLL
jgi:hypothetical protein